MTDDPLSHFNRVPLSARHAIDRLCTRFEAAWRAGEAPPLEAYLEEVTPDHHAALVTELLALDLEYRRDRGESPRPETYTERFPQFDALVLEAFGRHSLAPAGPPTIPGFEILAELGRGGMGVVYKARQRSLNRFVALKMIRASGGNVEDRVRFRLEAEAVAQLGHPNIVQVHESGEHQGQPYLVLELVEGGSLKEHVGKPWVPRVGAELVETLARAIHYSHTRGVVHRDLKPANILLAGDGVAKVTDFGLAKRLEVDTWQTREGLLVGTPAYMAPEQAHGDRTRVGPAVDVYALGVILYQLLTGRVPFEGSDGLATLLLMQSREPPPPSQIQKVPRDLETVCLKCLAKNPQQRYATAQDLADDLRRFLAGDPIQARPSTFVERAWRWTRRNPLPAALLAAVLFLLAAVAGVSSTAAVQLLAEREHSRQVENQHKRDQAMGLLTAASDSVPYLLDSLDDDPALIVPLLRQFEKDAADPARRLRAAIALTVLGEPRTEFLLDAVPHAPEAEGDNLALAFRSLPRSEAVALLSDRALTAADLDARVRYAILLLDLGDLSGARPLLGLGADQEPRYTLIASLPTWHGNLAPLAGLLRSCEDEACRSGLCAAVGQIDPDTLSDEVRDDLTAALTDLAQSAPDGGTHSAAEGALRRWRVPPPVAESTSGPIAGRRWFVNRSGMTMVRVEPGRFSPNPQTTLALTRPYYLDGREVTVGLYKEFLRDPDWPADQKPKDWVGLSPAVSPTDDCPVNNVLRNDMLLFCNWLSRREGRRPCYQQTGPTPHDWKWDAAADGYRLPTETEWDYAHRAGATTAFCFGSDTRWLTRFAQVASVRALPAGSKLPNGWGLFDMVGNVWEVCWDYAGPWPAGVVNDFRGAVDGPVWIGRGGAFDSGSYDCRANQRFRVDERGNTSRGFRVACSEAGAVRGDE